VRSRRGSGTYIPDGPPTLGAEALSFLAALHKFTVDDVYEARRILEVGAAGLAAERATPEQLATLADEVAGLFASLNDRQVFLVHDINFHRGIAAASGNPDRRLVRRDGVGALLRAAPHDRRARRRSRSARRRRRAPADLSGRPREGRRASAAADERSPAARAVVPGQGSARVDVQVQGSAEAESGRDDASPFDLTGRTAVVVGGTTGIGRALRLGSPMPARTSSPPDADRERWTTCRRRFEQRGRRTLRHPADVGDSASLQALRDACLKAFGHVDIVVAAAGITKRMPTLEMSEPTGARFSTPTSPGCSGPIRRSRRR
jgi:hypothetical protein